jgi:hypothetical protein
MSKTKLMPINKSSLGHEGEVRTRTYGTPKVSKSRKTKKITYKQEINIPKIPVPAQWT